MSVESTQSEQRPAVAVHRLVRLFRDSDRAGVEIAWKGNRLRIGWMFRISPHWCDFVGPCRAQDRWYCPAGTWHHRVWRLAVGFQPNASGEMPPEARKKL